MPVMVSDVVTIHLHRGVTIGRGRIVKKKGPFVSGPCRERRAAIDLV
jgi:hypothetical protein